MRLTKLELHGFKSFADHVHLVFEPGVTAVVGPNGCGKSNVSDAVRWVLGEQRARALRGAKMEEVIFQGSSARRAVNIAEVSLYFENDDGALAVPYREVVITRRLSRSGDSEYLLNGTACRLRDVQDMMRGTGLGADSGVVIEQRMIDALLSDRPDDRRELFEEAAGVGLYRDRRRSTERRLEETTVDLSRLDDLIAEVHTQVRSLARQRKKSERHTDLTARRFTAEITLASREMAAWHDELERLETRVTELRAAMPAAEEGVRAGEEHREHSHGARAAAEVRRAELGRRVGAQQHEALQLEGELRVAEERQRNALARLQRAEDERRQGEEVGTRLTREREGARTARLTIERELDAARVAREQRETVENDARRAVADARAVFDAAERDVRALRDALRGLELDGDAAERELAELTERTDALHAEREHAEDTLAAARSELAVSRRNADEGAAAAQATAEHLAAARAGADAARTADALARGELMRLDEHRTALEGKAHALEALERERVGLAPAAARLLRERERFGDGAVLGPLSDFLSAGSTDAATVERYLGASVHAVLVRDRDAADAIRAWHADANPGPLLLLPLDAARDDGDADDALARLVQSVEPARGWVRALLGRVHALAGGSAFVDARGAVWLPGSAAGPGPLRRRAELTDLREALASTERARAGAVTGADAARALLERAAAGVAAATDDAARAQQAERQAHGVREEAERKEQRSARELAGVTALAGKLTARRGELTERVSTLEQQHHATEASIVERDAQRSAAGVQLAERERSQDAARDERAHWQVTEAQLQARLRVAADRERQLEGEVTSAGARLDALIAELGEIAQSDRQLAEHIAEWRLTLAARQAALRDGESQLRDAEAAVQHADSTLENAEHVLAESHRRASQLSDELHHTELRFAELSSRRAMIRQRLETEWRRSLDDMLAAATPLEVDDQTLRAELDALRAELESIGPVNPLAVEEHEEEVKRLEFLNAQRADLQSAKTSLQQAIREIDVTAREMFLTTFAQVRENFRHIFMTLFGGGECDLRLENPDAPLDGDIEIHASPRGKRTQRIHLLSTGERALVALSLLFGIFLTKPSPFCLLDEVDGPLDDQNVGRFVRMLNRFKERTQFIVITHNPRTTTEAADTVYGVTMQEPGVSSFVSVRMKGPQQVADAEAEASVVDA
ncbi:MAG TPA: chromosome segregation protein SMC [Gemmatimonadaceae bacterium]